MGDLRSGETTAWLPGTPEGDALARVRANAATDDDLVLVALTECQQAIESLPPHAVAPNANNMGEVVLADPYHASASAMRARAMLLRLRERGLRSSDPQPAPNVLRELWPAVSAHLDDIEYLVTAREPHMRKHVMQELAKLRKALDPFAKGATAVKGAKP